MYEITKNVQTVDGVSFVTYSRDIKDNPYSMQVEAGTTGNYGREAITYFRIKNIKGVKFKIKPISMNGSDGVEIILYGNSGLRLLLIGLKFIRKVLIDCVKGKIF